MKKILLILLAFLLFLMGTVPAKETLWEPGDLLNMQ